MLPRQRLAAGLLLTIAAATPLAAQRAQRYELRVGNRLRSAELRLPSAAPTGRRPLVIVLHGGGGNAANAEQMTGFTRLVEREGIVVAYPNGSARRAGREALLTWNARHCCAAAMEQDVDDVGFLSALIDTLVAAQSVDPRRVFVTGMSNGGMMSHVAALRLGGKVAAIAPVVGTLFGDEPAPAAPVRAIIFNGLRDESVPFAGGPPGGLGRNAWRREARPSLEQGMYWARANGCGLEPRRDSVANVVTYRWPCPRGQEVELHAVVDAGHVWPGGRAGRRVGADRVPARPDATELMWNFFKETP